MELLCKSHLFSFFDGIAIDILWGCSQSGSICEWSLWSLFGISRWYWTLLHKSACCFAGWLFLFTLCWHVIWIWSRKFISKPWCILTNLPWAILFPLKVLHYCYNQLTYAEIATMVLHYRGIVWEFNWKGRVAFFRELLFHFQRWYIDLRNLSPVASLKHWSFKCCIYLWK